MSAQKNQLPHWSLNPFNSGQDSNQLCPSIVEWEEWVSIPLIQGRILTRDEEIIKNIKERLNPFNSGQDSNVLTIA